MRAAIESALTLSKKTGNRGIKLFISTTAAQVWAEVGNTANALDALSSTITESRKYGYIAAELEARLAFGELQMRTGKLVNGADLEII